MNTRSKKAKGRRLQLYVVELILKAFPELTEDDVRSVPASVPGPDIQLSANAKRVFPFSVECKNQERINLYKFWEQTVANAKRQSLEPLLVVKSNYKPALAVLKIETFINLLGVYKNESGRYSPNRGGKVGKERL